MNRVVLIAIVSVGLISPIAFSQELESNGWQGAAGLSFIATSGNSESSSLGLTGNWALRRDIWSASAGLETLKTEEEGETVSERLSLFTRGSRKIRDRLGVTAGWQGERNRFAGIDFRSTFDAGLDWNTIDREEWVVDTVLSATWTTEDLVGFEQEDNVGALLLVRSLYEFSERARSNQLLRFEPNFEEADDFRAEGRISLSSDFTELFALKLGAALFYDNEPVPGFESTDTTLTASIVLNVDRLEAGE